jgi:hypothetical protein
MIPARLRASRKALANELAEVKRKHDRLGVRELALLNPFVEQGHNLIGERSPLLHAAFRIANVDDGRLSSKPMS